jgi:hypothetical protein
MDSPANVLHHALLALRDLPAVQREAWHHLFNHYVFGFKQDSTAHLPEQRRGILAPMDDAAARKLRAQLLNKLKR